MVNRPRWLTLPQPATGLILAAATTLAGASVVVGTVPAWAWNASSAMTLIPRWLEGIVGATALLGGAITAWSWRPTRRITMVLRARRAGTIIATPGLAGYALIVGTAPQHGSLAAAIISAGLLAGMWAEALDAIRLERTL